MRSRLFHILRLLALLGLALVLLGCVTTFAYCAFGWSGRTGTAQFLDIICSMEEPRISYRGHGLLALINRLTMSGLLGGFILLVSGMMAVLFHFAFPKQPEAPDYRWPGKSAPKPQKADHGGRPEW